MKEEERDVWTWEMPPNEEFERRRRTENFYRIYHLEGKEEVSDFKFWGKDATEARETLARWKASANAAPGTEYFWSTSGYYIDPDGRRFDSLKESMKAYLSEISLLERISIPFSRLWDRAKDVWWRLKDALRRAFTGHSIVESWDLMFHMLDDLEHNLPLLIRHTNSYPDGITFDEWRKIMEDLLLHVRLYRFYSDYGIVHGDDPGELEFGETWRMTIPTVEGTNGEIDYVKLNELTQKEWNSVMDILREWGQSLWD